MKWCGQRLSMATTSQNRESDPDGSEAWIFCVFWILLPVFNKWREQRNILNDAAGYSQQNPDYGQAAGQKIVPAAKKKKKKGKNYKEEERDIKRRETCIKRERENLLTQQYRDYLDSVSSTLKKILWLGKYKNRNLNTENIMMIWWLSLKRDKF